MSQSDQTAKKGAGTVALRNLTGAAGECNPFSQKRVLLGADAGTLHNGTVVSRKLGRPRPILSWEVPPVRKGLLLLLTAALLLAAAPWSASANLQGKKKKIVLVGMERDHGPGEHEYMAGLALIAECLKQTPGLEA